MSGYMDFMHLEREEMIQKIDDLQARLETRFDPKAIRRYSREKLASLLAALTLVDSESDQDGGE